MTRCRFGRISARGLGLSLTFALLASVSACGDDDDGSSDNGTSGTPGTAGSSPTAGSGGTKSGGGGTAGAPQGGSSGGTSSGTAGNAGSGARAGSGGAGTAGETGGDGGAGAAGGSGGLGMGGDGGFGGSAGSLAGAGGVGGVGQGGQGGGGAGAGGGGTQEQVEYRSCESTTAINRVSLYRIDRSLGTCTFVEFQQAAINCLDDLKSGGWCVSGAIVSDDVETCEDMKRPGEGVQATGGDGTFSIGSQPATVTADLTLEFPSSGDLPESVSIQVTNCLADCLKNDCRP